DVTEVAKDAGASGNDAAGDLVVISESLFGAAVVVCANDAIIEVLKVNDIQSNVFLNLIESPFRCFQFISVLLDGCAPSLNVSRYRAHASRGLALLDGFALSGSHSLRSFAAAHA